MRRQCLLKMIKKIIIVTSILCVLILGGCSRDMDGAKKNADQSEENNVEDVYVPVQEYTGEGYKLDNGEVTGRIANENRAVVEKAVKRFFKEEYKTEVTVHHIAGNVDGATVFVESIGKPHFYTYAIIPIDVKNEEILEDNVWSQEWQIEDAIIAGIYGLILEEEFNNLTNLISEITEKHNLVGINSEAIPIGANRFSNDFYFVSIRDESPFIPIIESYLENPNRSEEEWSEMININDVNPESIRISVNLYMEDANAKPNEKTIEMLKTSIEETDNLPKGMYGLSIHDNNINKRKAVGSNKNSIRIDNLIKD